MAFLDWDADAFPRPRLRKPGAKPSPLSLAQIAAGLPSEEALIEEVRAEARIVVPTVPRVRTLTFDGDVSAGATVFPEVGPIPYPYILRKILALQRTGTEETVQVRLHSISRGSSFSSANAGNVLWPTLEGTGDTIRLRFQTIEITPNVPVGEPDETLIMRVRNFGGVDAGVTINATYEEILSLPIG